MAASDLIHPIANRTPPAACTAFGDVEHLGDHEWLELEEADQSDKHEIGRAHGRQVAAKFLRPVWRQTGPPQRPDEEQHDAQQSRSKRQSKVLHGQIARNIADHPQDNRGACEIGEEVAAVDVGHEVMDEPANENQHGHCKAGQCESERAPEVAEK